MSDDGSVALPHQVKTSNTFKLPGYLLDPDSLNRICQIARQLVGGTEETPFGYEIRAIHKNAKQETLRGTSINGLVENLGQHATVIEDFDIRFGNPELGAVNVNFGIRGDIDLRAYSNAVDCQVNLDRLKREIKECDQQSGWFVRTFVYNPNWRRFLAVGVVLMSISLTILLASYAYAHMVGVNIDSSHILSDNVTITRIDEAIKSNDPNKKLDALLMAQITQMGFVNLSDFLRDERRFIIDLLIAIVVLSLVVLSLRWLRSLYPRAFFLFGGSQIRTWAKLQKRREILVTAIIIGFIINLLAGVMVAILMTSGR
jgi:hypothetical protein